MVGRRTSLFILILSLGITALPAWVAGQGMGSAGTVKGTVKDPSGAVIPGATARIYNPVTGFERTASTDASVRLGLWRVCSGMVTGASSFFFSTNASASLNRWS